MGLRARLIMWFAKKLANPKAKANTPGDNIPLVSQQQLDSLGRFFKQWNVDPTGLMQFIGGFVDPTPVHRCFINGRDCNHDSTYCHFVCEEGKAKPIKEDVLIDPQTGLPEPPDHASPSTNKYRQY
jgi:hypothetical protein